MSGDRPIDDGWHELLAQLIAERRAVAASVDHREMLQVIGTPPGPVSDVGTRALEEQRAERLP